MNSRLSFQYDPVQIVFPAIITGYYGRLRLLTQGQLTDPSLNFPFTKTTTICEKMEAIR